MEVNSFDDWLKKGSSLEEDTLDGFSADRYAEKKGVDVKTIPPREKSELAGGGPIDSTMVDIVADLESATGFQFTVTSGNDEFHQGISTYKSNHTTGKAIDIVSPKLKSRNNRTELERAIVDLIKSGKYNKDGLRLGGINEYDNASSKSTGGHFHISLTPDSHERDSKEYKLFWKEEKRRWALHLQDKSLYEFGDKIIKNKERDIFLHFPTREEVISSLEEAGFVLIEGTLRSELCEESEEVKRFSTDCVLWLVQKP